MKTILGADLFACSKRSLTLEAPTPTNISTKSEPLMKKKGTPASPATALPRRVLPVPGEPNNKTPFGILAPILLYLAECFKKSTISRSSSFASSTPATSANVTFFLESESLCLLLPKEKAPNPPPPPPPVGEFIC